MACFGSGKERLKLILLCCLYLYVSLLEHTSFIDRDPRMSSGLDEAFEAVIIYGLGLPIFNDSMASATKFFLSS